MSRTANFRLQPICFFLILLIAFQSLAFGNLPPSQYLGLPAVIKTQKAADSIQNGIRGIDVSEYQGNINWTKVANDGINFAIMRASIGMRQDNAFVYNAQQAHKNGILVGAYHYAKFTSTASAVKEAEFFVDVLKKVDITYPVVLDLELHHGVSKGNLTKAALAFMEVVEKAGYKIMLYSYENFFDTYINTSSFKNYDLWVANYIALPKRVDHKIWQHTSYGQVSGISTRVDINIAYHDLRINKKITVNKNDSNAIKAFLNDSYNASLSMEQLVMSDMKTALVKGLQSELNKQLGVNLSVDGQLNAKTLQYLESLSFRKGDQNNIISLAQSALFYKGCYTGALTGTLDARTMEAVKAFQNQRGSGDGQLNTSTLKTLFRA